MEKDNKLQIKENSRVITIIVAVLSVLLIVISIYGNKNSIIKDNKRFYREYKLVSTDNVFVYKNADEIINMMEHGTGVVYLGFPECPWCQSYVRYLNELAIEVGIDEIYYYNIKKDRDNNTDNYKKMVSILENYLLFDNKGVKRIYVPNVSFHINGEVIAVDFETAFDTNGLDNPDDYWTDDAIMEFKNKLYDPMMRVKSSLSVCTDCNK